MDDKVARLTNALDSLAVARDMLLDAGQHMSQVMSDKERWKKLIDKIYYQIYSIEQLVKKEQQRLKRA